jgi:hypothetical protein
MLQTYEISEQATRGKEKDGKVQAEPVAGRMHKHPA